MVFHGPRTPEGDALRVAPGSGASLGTRPPDQRVVTPLNVGGHPCEEPLARSRLRLCPQLRCSPQVAAAATAATAAARPALAPRRAARSPFVGATRRTRSSRATPTDVWWQR